MSHSYTDMENTRNVSDRSTMQNILVIWFDSARDPSMDDYRSISTQLTEFVSGVYFFDDPDQCVDFLTDIDDAKVLMVVRSTAEQQVASLIYEVPHLESIYIYCDKEQQIRLSPKFQHVLTQAPVESIFEILRKAIMQHHRNDIPLSFIEMDENGVNPKMDQLEPSFMYTQILKEILLDVEYDQRSIDNVINFCEPSDKVNEFVRNYRSQSAINWYTRAAFIYGTLNRSLRLFETDMILQMGFFIRDLHHEIQQLYLEQSSNYNEQSIVLYRGQGLSTSDFEKLKKTKDGLIAFNNFLSTSSKREAALQFAECNATASGMIGVLFEINVDLSISSVPFADIHGSSQFVQEEEVLFSMHTVFRIGKIDRIDDSNDVYQVNLTLTADNDEQLCTLAQHVQKETGDAKGLQKLGPIFMRIGRYDKVVEWYEMLATHTSNEDHKRNFWSNVAYAKNKQGDFDGALSIYNQVIPHFETVLSEDDPKLADIYNNVAGVYFNREDCSNAFSFYEKAIAIRKNIFPTNHRALAETYNNIGAVYCKMGLYSKALQYYEQGLEIFKQILSDIHPDLSTLHNNIAAIYNDLGDYSKALSHYIQALKIAQRSLPPHHPDLALSFNNIGTVYQNIGKYHEALSSYRAGLKIRQQVGSPNLTDIAQSYTNIGAALVALGQFPEALSSYEEACRTFERRSSPNGSDLSTCYNNIGHLYGVLGQHSESLLFLKKAIGIEEKLIPSHPSLATSYNNLGLSYCNMHDYSEALHFYEKAFDIRSKILPSNHPDLAQSYSNIGGVFKQMKNYSKALSLHTKAIEILEQVIPPNYPDLANTYMNTGLLYRQMDDYSQAMAFYKKALEICQTFLPANHPLLANCYHNMGVAYYYQGQFSEALKFLQRALDIFRMTYPWYHPKIQDAQQSIENLKRQSSINFL